MKIIRNFNKNIIADTWYYAKDKIKKTLIILGLITIVFAADDLTKNEVSLEKIQQKYEQAIELKDKYQLDGTSLIRKDIKNLELDAYKNEPKDEIKITIGDKDKTEFVPDIELKRWNEISFKIKPNLEGVATKDKDLTFEGEKIKFDTPKISFEMYEYTEGEGGYKFIWYLNEKPATNKVEFQIETSGLNFFRQPSLTEEYQNGYSEEFQKEIVVSETQVKDLEGNVLVERPENVVGSYAVYHQTKGGMNDINGKEYKTGQAFMIYRPHIIDAEGKETWGNLHIENGIYSVEIPQDFLDTCRYPIKSNDTFGYTTAGGSFTFTAANRAFISKGSPTSSGTVSKISIYAARNTADTNFKGVIWLVSDKTIITNGVAGTVTITGAASWLDVNYGTNPDVVSGTNYYVGGVSDVSGGYLLYNTGVSGDGGISESNSYATPISLGTIGVNDRRHSIYATYTASGGGAAAEPEFYYQIIE